MALLVAQSEDRPEVVPLAMNLSLRSVIEMLFPTYEVPLPVRHQDADMLIYKQLVHDKEDTPCRPQDLHLLTISQYIHNGKHDHNVDVLHLRPECSSASKLNKSFRSCANRYGGDLKN